MRMDGCLCVLIAFGSLEFEGRAIFSQPRLHCSAVDCEGKLYFFKSLNDIGIGVYWWGCVFFGIGGA